MKIYSAIVGNLHAPEWAARAEDADLETIELDQWTAQKSRFAARSDRGAECAVALERHAQLLDGDILEYDPAARRMVVLRIRLNEVMVADLGELAHAQPEEIIHIALELGHAIGNQHWPAVVKGTKVYVPLTVDKKVMESVMRTHRIEHVVCTFQPGEEVIPYLAPHEIRRLFGGASHESRTEEHLHSHRHAHV